MRTQQSSRRVFGSAADNSNPELLTSASRTGQFRPQPAQDRSPYPQHQAIVLPKRGEIQLLRTHEVDLLSQAVHQSLSGLRLEDAAARSSVTLEADGLTLPEGVDR